MKKSTLTSTAALMVGLTVSPALAQNAPFPCEAEPGTTVETAEAYAEFLTEQMANGDEIDLTDPALCGPRAARQAKRSAGDALADLTIPRGNGAETNASETGSENAAEGTPAANANADQSADAAPEAGDDATMAEGDATAGDEAATVADTPADGEASGDMAAAPAATDAPAGEPDTMTAESEADTTAETTAAAPDAAEPAAPAAAEAAGSEASEPAAPEAAAAADPATTAEAPVVEGDVAASGGDAEVTSTGPTDEELANELAAGSAAETAGEPATDSAADPATDSTADGSADMAADGATDTATETTTGTDEAATAETGGTEGGEGRIGAQTSADSSVPPADGESADVEAQTTAATDTPPEVTPEQRARREQRRAERAAARRESAAGQADAAPAETSTEELTQDDVRQADEDFQTQVLSDAEAGTEEEDGLSNFEKAILLGLGAVATGAILNNGDEVVSNSGDRLIVQREGELRVLKDDNALLRQPGAQVETQTYNDGSTLTTVTRQNGSRVVTVRSADGTVLRRTLYRADGTEVALIDDLSDTVQPVDVSQLPQVQERDAVTLAGSDDAALRAALTANLLARSDRTYSLEQVRDIQPVRDLAPEVELDTVTFATGSAAIQPSEADELGSLGRAISQIVQENPSTVFLVEGHTDAVGDAAYNLGLSDRRAETVALALTQYFGVPPENLVTQGYGEQYLKVPTLEAERANRRAAVRNITQLLRDS